MPDEAVAEDWRAPHFADRDVFAWYVAGDKAVSGPVTVDEEYSQENGDWAENLCYFRFTGKMPQNVDEAQGLLNERCFFPPVFIWYQDKFIDPWRDLKRGSAAASGWAAG